MTTQHILALLFGLTATASFINYKFVRLPKSIGLTLVTLALSLVLALFGALGFDWHTKAQVFLLHIDFSRTFFSGLLSFLLFAGSLHVNLLELARHKWMVGALASMGVLISSMLIGVAVWGVTLLLPFQIPFIYCLIFGTLISPTDPITVFNVFKTVKVPRAIQMKIAGEALFNDGMVVVLFVIFLAIATGQKADYNTVKVILTFLHKAGGGLLLGALLGGVVAYLMRGVANFEVAILMTLALAMGAPIIAEHWFHVSDVITVVVSGLIIGHSCRKGRMSKRTIAQLDSFWELVDEVLNAILFVLIGLEVVSLSVNNTVIILALVAIPISVLARYISVLLPITIVKGFRDFNQQLLILMTWSGMRGGVSIALALSLPNVPSRDLIVSITFAVVLFSILVQGLTLERVIKALLPRAQ